MLKNILKVTIIIFLFFSINKNLYANYNININDQIKIYKIEKKIQKYIKTRNIKGKNLEILLKLLKNKIKNYLNTNNINNKKKYNSFKEYAFIKIYNFIDFGDIFYNTSYQILENNYFKILVINKDVKINNDYLFDKNGFKYITIINLKKGDSIESYLKKNIIAKNCKIVYNPKNFIRKIKYNFIILKPEKTNSPCISKLDNYGIRYFIIKNNKLLYINEGQDYNGIDFETLEIKN